MAVYEKDTLLRCKDENGNEYLLYPITRLDCVDGAEDLVHYDKDQELTAGQKAQFLKNIGGLCAPVSAQANQFLKVSAVDANGNVTAVETAVIEGGSGGSSGTGEAVQSDWSVTDENDPAYIKNKPFGETSDGVKQLDNKYLSIMETTAKDVLPEGNVEFYWDSAEGIWRNNTYVVSDSNWKNLVALYEAGQKLDVEIGGETYSVDITAGAMNDNGSYSGFMIGDVNHTNYPFWIMISAGESSNRTLMPKQDVTLGYEQFGYPVGIGYPEEFGVEPVTLVIGETYEVTWGDKVYTCIAQDGNLVEEGMVILGNCTTLGVDGLNGNNEPFILGVATDNAIMLMGVKDAEVGGTYAFGLSLPIAYTCDIWLDASKGEPGEANIFPEQDIIFDTPDSTYGKYTKTIMPPPCELELGATYRVVWGDNSYTLPTVDTNGLITNSISMGDGSEYGYPQQDAPFIIMYNPGADVGTYTIEPNLTFISLTDAPATYNIAIYKEVGPTLPIHGYGDERDVIKKECLPDNIGNSSGGSGEQVQSDWSVTDETDPAYIKNKPTIADGIMSLPEVSVADAGKFLRVTDEGVWAAVTIPYAEGTEF